MTDERETYTHGHAESVLRSHRQRTAANSAGYLLDRLRPGLELLDVGCGPGTITVDLARLVAPGRVLAIDAAADVVAAAAAEVTAAGVDTVDVRVGDVYALEARTTPSTWCTPTRCCSTSPARSTRCGRCGASASRVVWSRRGTRIYRAFTWSPAEPSIDRWLEVYCAVAEANGGEPDAGLRLEAWAREAGFTEVETGVSSWHWATPRRAPVVVGPVGGPHLGHAAGRPGHRAGPGDARGARRPRRGLAPVGCPARRLVRRALGRAPG